MNSDNNDTPAMQEQADDYAQCESMDARMKTPTPCFPSFPPKGPPPKSAKEATGPKSHPAKSQLPIPIQTGWTCVDRSRHAPSKTTEQSKLMMTWRVPKASITPQLNKNQTRLIKQKTKGEKDNQSCENQENVEPKWNKLPIHMRHWNTTTSHKEKQTHMPYVGRFFF